MKTLLVAAHGSRREESNYEIIALAEAIKQRTGPRFDSVKCAFIQFTRPLLGELIDTLAREGAEKIVVFPLFMAAGSHVKVDIPEEIQKAKERHPQVEIAITAHLGKIERVKDLIVSEAEKY